MLVKTDVKEFAPNQGDADGVGDERDWREFYVDHPPWAEYALTAKGKKMSVIIGAMRDWGAKYG